MSYQADILGTHINILSGFAFKSNDFVDSGIPVIKIKNITPPNVSMDDLSYVLDDVIPSKYILNYDDVLIAMTGSHINQMASVVGRVARVKCSEKTALNQRVGKITVIDPDDCDLDYVYYYLSQEKVKIELANKAGGAANQANISPTDIKNLAIPFPNINIQRKISSVLRAYDDLIENNQKQIKLLEEAAQRLYKEWFVDFRFPGHENTKITDGIPEGWKKCRLSEIIAYEIGGGWGEVYPMEKCDVPAYVVRGTDIYSITHGNALSIPYRYHEKRNLNMRQLKDGDIVFEVSGGSKTEGVARTALIRSSMLKQWDAPVMCASFCKLVRLKERDLAQVLFDAFQYMRASGKTTEYDKRSASSIVNYRWKDFLADEAILIPDKLTLEKYNALASNMYQLIIQKAAAIEHATTVRNRLLPKLMSGEIEV